MHRGIFKMAWVRTNSYRFHLGNFQDFTAPGLLSEFEEKPTEDQIFTCFSEQRWVGDVELSQFTMKEMDNGELRFFTKGINVTYVEVV